MCFLPGMCLLGMRVEMGLAKVFGRTKQSLRQQIYYV